MKRIRRTAMAAIVLFAVLFAVSFAACADDAPELITAVAVAATPCDRPTARLGVGTVVEGGYVLTAAHVVEDELRGVDVDGRPAHIVALDARIDAAVLALDTPIDDRAATMSDVDVADAVRIVTPTGVIDTTVRRIVRLSVDDTTDDVVNRRATLVLDGSVAGGTSGAPVVDDDGRVVGMVTISHAGRDVTYATRTGELQPLIEAVSTPGHDSVTRSSLAAQKPCA